ncbi:hypothetical protein CHLRE_05g238270v5 [Chlamydomonas reinhardtii]|uniref:Uncharacterized protein n=1 Tax=Chlamydomonas reinhardtii TaxID=3055 RepID=A0A2K3DSZ1_CHLRE|nr:uncharacterized protein CHLRE_05g238270v5 [Chlamydomonas reinhardtii]PNW83653.1 hypothetical protein CHLRE_05g238270v5 [Chlamydomonas reinhardtii]
MGWEFTDHHVRPNVFYWAPKAHKEREEVKTRRDAAQAAYEKAKKATAEGRHAEAEQLLLHSVTAWPDNPRFSHALAHCIFLDRGRPADGRGAKRDTLAEIVEAERQIMLWERKIQLEKEMQEVLDPTVGQDVVAEMKKEIHRMTLRHTELMRLQG